MAHLTPCQCIHEASFIQLGGQLSAAAGAPGVRCRNVRGVICVQDRLHL